MYTQSDITQQMEKLGYEPDWEGVCFGITYMEIQAILIGERTKFEDRIRLIVETDDLKSEIKQAQERIKERDNLKKKQKRIEKITEEVGELSEEDFKRLEDIKVRLKLLEDKLPEDLKLLEVLSFFDGIMLYQNELKASEWFSKNIVQTKPLKVSKFVYPSILKEGSIEEGAKVELKEGGIEKVYSRPGIYTETELSSYLKQLSEILKKLPDHDKIAIQISCFNHAMLLPYDSKNEQWNFFDPNQLLKKPVNREKIADKVVEGFREVPITAFNTTIYTTKNYADEHNPKEFLKVLHDIPEHNINQNRAEMKTDRNTSLLLIATKYGHLEIVKVLLEKIEKLEKLEKGATINLPDNDGYTALHLAVQNGHLDVVNTLLANGAKVDFASSEHATALHLAAQNGRLEIVNALIKNGATIDSTDNNGYTALHMAAIFGHLDVVNALIKNGANIHLENKHGKTALKLAEQYKHPHIVNAFEAIVSPTSSSAPVIFTGSPLKNNHTGLDMNTKKPRA